MTGSYTCSISDATGIPGNHRKHPERPADTAWVRHGRREVPACAGDDVAAPLPVRGVGEDPRGQGAALRGTRTGTGVDLVGRVVNVSLRTVDIVDGLPALDL